MSAAHRRVRIYKRDAHEPGISRYGREALEEFPREARRELGAEAGEEPPDPETMRQQILADAKTEAEQKVQEAYQEGLRRGYEAGLEEFRGKVQNAADVLEQAAQGMQNAHERFLGSLEPHVLEMVGLLARRVLQREAATDPELIQNTARRALEHIADRHRLLVRVNPEDLAVLREHEADLVGRHTDIERIEIEPDPAVPRGGCIVDSERMQADARLETLLEHLLKDLHA